MQTLESIFIKRYEEMEQALKYAQLRIEELESKEQNKSVEDDKPVVIKTFSKECCYLDVASSWSIARSDVFKNMTSDEIKEIIENEEKIRAYADTKNSDDYYNYVQIKTRAFPYSSVIQGCVVLLDVYTNHRGEFETYCSVLGDKDNLKTNLYYDIKEKDRLYEYGLKVFKENLQEVYESKLKKEIENG